MKYEKYETPVQVKTNACSTIYKVGEHEVELIMITGGTPALDFVGFGYSKRFPIKDERWVDPDFSKDGIPETGKWLSNEGRYQHQDPNNIQGPTLDVLPNGIQSLYEYLDEMLPRKALRESRLAQFSYPSLESKRYYDKENRTYFRLRANVQYGRIPCVTAVSNIYSGRCERNLKLPCVSKEWVDLAAFINPIVDGKIPAGRYKPFALDDLTEDLFQTLLALYNKIAND